MFQKNKSNNIKLSNLVVVLPNLWQSQQTLNWKLHLKTKNRNYPPKLNKKYVIITFKTLIKSSL